MDPAPGNVHKNNNNNNNKTSNSMASTDTNATTKHNQGAEPFPYPRCWQDQERMSVLLAPFRVRSVNPESYDSKMKFWQTMIAQYCEHKGEPCFSLKELELVFTRDLYRPQCLDAVLAALLQAHEVRERGEYVYDPGNTWSGWVVNKLVKRPLSWSLNKIKTSVWLADPNANREMQYVHLEMMRAFCHKLQTQVLDTNRGKLLHYSELQKLIAASTLPHNEDCIKLCLHTLHAQRQIGMEFLQGSEQLHLIKIPMAGKVDDIIITENERAVHKLHMTKANLLQQLESIEADIQLNSSKAAQYLKENKRQLAKTYVRKKLLLEKNHEKRSLALHNIEALLSSVDEAQSQGEILDAYKIGSKALQNALNKSGLKYDNVDEVISDMRETLDTHRELQDTLASAGQFDNEVLDDVELERELHEIVDENKILQMPATPNSDNKNTILTKVVIDDAELLAMLDELEVADKSLSQQTASSPEPTMQ